MTVDEASQELAYEAPVPSAVGKRRLGRGGKVLKRLQRTKQPDELLSLTVPPVSVAALKKLAPKRAKPSSKFARKKYACPHCNRRFLTRGNIKNHLRIHSRDKPFNCPICQVSPIITSIKYSIGKLSCWYIFFLHRTCLPTKVFISVT